MDCATFLGTVGGLARSLLRDPQKVEVASHTDTHANIEQRLHWADNFAHKNALLDHILTQREVEQALVFTSTQIDADRLADRLAEMGHAVASLHGGMPQGRRNRVLQGLRDGRLKILVATDVAARGIDVRTISHVINYGLPMKPEDYVHRIGRTGRAGANGLAITLAERMDTGMIRRIQQFTTQSMPVTTIAGLEPKVQARRRCSPHAPGARGHQAFVRSRTASRRCAPRSSEARARAAAARGNPLRPRLAGARRAPRSGGPAGPVVVQAARQAGAASAPGRLLTLSSSAVGEDAARGGALRR